MKHAYSDFNPTIEHIAGENHAAFELLESKACCNKTLAADCDDMLWEANYDLQGKLKYALQLPGRRH